MNLTIREKLKSKYPSQIVELIEGHFIVNTKAFKGVNQYRSDLANTLEIPKNQITNVDGSIPFEFFQVADLLKTIYYEHNSLGTLADFRQLILKALPKINQQPQLMSKKVHELSNTEKMLVDTLSLILRKWSIAIITISSPVVSTLASHLCSENSCILEIREVN